VVKDFSLRQRALPVCMASHVPRCSCPADHDSRVAPSPQKETCLGGRSTCDGRRQRTPRRPGSIRTHCSRCGTVGKVRQHERGDPLFGFKVVLNGWFAPRLQGSAITSMAVTSHMSALVPDPRVALYTLRFIAKETLLTHHVRRRVVSWTVLSVAAAPTAGVRRTWFPVRDSLCNLVCPSSPCGTKQATRAPLAETTCMFTPALLFHETMSILRSPGCLQGRRALRGSGRFAGRGRIFTKKSKTMEHSAVGTPSCTYMTIPQSAYPSCTQVWGYMGLGWAIEQLSPFPVRRPVHR
jgi:hypothetical protein